jgi:hypothetical protein
MADSSFTAWLLMARFFGTTASLQELVLKDMAVEPEAEALRRGAHLMVTGLAQSLALVTAKEPLRIAVANNLRALLANQLDANTLEQVGTEHGRHMGRCGLPSSAALLGCHRPHAASERAQPSGQ